MCQKEFFIKADVATMTSLFDKVISGFNVFDMLNSEVTYFDKMSI